MPRQTKSRIGRRRSSVRPKGLSPNVVGELHTELKRLRNRLKKYVQSLQ